jgi:hypothetical protein
MSIEKLLSIASEAIGVTVVTDVSASIDQWRSKSFRQLLQMLSEKNGFFAFEGALHVFPWTDSADKENYLGLQAWNEKTLWRDWYQGLTDGLFFFAEDAFGGQFAIRGNEIVSFDPESGDIDIIAPSFESWVSELLSNYAQLTGYPLAHSWQLINGPIPVGQRLLPKTPFILGGCYEENNLYAVDAVLGMRYRGELWEQLRDLPDGAQVRLRVLPVQ